MKPAAVSRDDARRWLVSHLGVAQPAYGTGAEGVRTMLRSLRCVQLDPLDPIGTNADLVALARVDGIARGDVYRHLLPGHAFEHFAKERCLLPASAFPYYRAYGHGAQTTWWRHAERVKRLGRGVIGRVLAEVRARGPISAAELEDHGEVERMDWAGWTGTGRATSMALEVLWTRCDVVVAGRSGRAKVFDVPERALGDACAPKVAAKDFARWAVVERVAAAGLLARASGPMWSMLGKVRSSPLIDRMVREGRIEEVAIEGAARPYLAPAGWRNARIDEPDARVRILGPLDALLWDRKLVAHLFGFDYVWEVYKPASERRWGWYVCPLLFRGALVGRIEARLDGRTLVVDRLWRERGAELPDDALRTALERHATACGADAVRLPRGSARQAGGVGKPASRNRRSRSRKTRTT